MQLRVDPSIDQLLPEGDDERAFYERARLLFGSDEFVLVVLAADDVVTPDRLARIQRITERVAALDGVDRVLSIANATDIRGVDGDIAVGPFFETVPTDPAEIARLRERLLSHPVYADNLIASDGRTTMLLAYFDHISDREFVARRLSLQIQAIADAERGDAQIFVTGAPHVKLALSETLLAEMRFILPAILAVAALLALLAFRSLRGVLLLVTAIGMALVWTLGLMGWTGTSLTLVSNIVPPLIITLGFAAAVHVISEYYEMARHAGPIGRDAHDGVVARMIEQMGLAVAVNGFTTALGFASLTVSRVLAIRDFGIWAVVGVLATTIVALTFVPAALAVLGPTRRAHLAPRRGRIDVFAERLAPLRRAEPALDLRDRVRCARARIRRCAEDPRRQRVHQGLCGRRAGACRLRGDQRTTRWRQRLHDRGRCRRGFRVHPFRESRRAARSPDLARSAAGDLASRPRSPTS